MTILVANGCSNTAGAELYNGIAEHPENRKLSYVNKLANRLGLEHINLAINGGSNDYIFRSTIEFINNNLKSISDYCFLIAWTSAQRIELRYHNDDAYFYYNAPKFYDNKYVQITSGMDHNALTGRRIRNLIKNHKIDLLEIDFCSDKFANYAFSLQSIFELYNIKYFMYNTIHGQSTTKNNKKTISRLIKNPRYYKPTDSKETFFFYCRDDLGFTDLTKWYHHKQPAHDAWADILYERCNTFLK